MSEKSANHQTAATGHLNGAVRQLFTAYGQQDESLVLAWLPILLGLLVSAIVALAFCPVPRSQTVSGARASFLAVAYVVETTGTGAFVLAACGIIARRRGLELSLVQIVPGFCDVAVWMTPVVAFYMRNSLWAALTASVLAVLTSRLIYRHHLAIGEHEMPQAGAELQITSASQSTSLMLPAFAALLLQLAVLSSVASMARPAAIFIGSAIFVISFFHETVTAPNQSQFQAPSPSPVRLWITSGLAIVWVGASLTPYLMVPSEDAGSGNASIGTERLTAKPARPLAKPTTGFAQSAGSLFHKLLTDQPQARAHGKPADEVSRPRPYPALQALFGVGEMATGPESGSLEKSKNTTATMLVGVIRTRG